MDKKEEKEKPYKAEYLELIIAVINLLTTLVGLFKIFWVGL
ncbi:hypothetical protein [Peptoniphilus asaccharolyticus]|nr:hypothetical protein [Peptoniphilus asaccharolyticus]